MTLWSRREQELESLVHHWDRGVQHLAIRDPERLAQAGAVPSVGMRGDGYDHALAETVVGLYKTDLAARALAGHRSGRARHGRVGGLRNQGRLHRAANHLPPAELERRWREQFREADVA